MQHPRTEARRARRPTPPPSSPALSRCFASARFSRQNTLRALTRGGTLSDSATPPSTSRHVVRERLALKRLLVIGLAAPLIAGCGGDTKTVTVPVAATSN